MFGCVAHALSSPQQALTAPRPVGTLNIPYRREEKCSPHPPDREDVWDRGPAVAGWRRRPTAQPIRALGVRGGLEPGHLITTSPTSADAGDGLRQVKRTSALTTMYPPAISATAAAIWRSWVVSHTLNRLIASPARAGSVT